MKKAVVSVACLVLACGCIKVEHNLALNRDGSGVLEISYSVPEQTVTQIKAMLKLERELAIAAGESPDTYTEDEFTRLVFDPDEARLLKKLSELAEYGITIKNLNVRSRGARRNVDLKIAFANIADVAGAGFFNAYGFSLVKTGDGNYAWIRRGDRSADAAPPDVSDPETLRALDPLLGGFSFALTVSPPGRILKTDAPSKTPNSATWKFDFDHDPIALWAVKTRNMTIIFDGKGLTLPEVRQNEVRSATPQTPTAPPEEPRPDGKSGS